MNRADADLDRRTDLRHAVRALVRIGVVVAGGAAIGMALAGTAGAQSTLTPTVFVRPSPSPYLTDWERDPSSAYLNVVNGSGAATDFRLDAFVRINGREIGRVRSPELSAVPGGVQVFGLTEILEWSTVSRDAGVVSAALRTGRLPEGRLALCVQVLSAASAPVGAPVCTERDIRLPEPPQLLAPANQSRVSGVQPLFQWAPITASPGSTLQYRVRIVERQPEQTPAVAMEANPAHYSGTVGVASPLLVYPPDALPFRDDREYAWRVEVVDANGTAVTRDGRGSEIWTFRAGDLTTPLPKIADLPDVVVIAPGVAELSGLRSATVTPASNEFGLRVDGPLTLSIYLPFRADIPVTATGVMLDRLRLPNFRLLAGTLQGRLDPKDVPTTLTGEAVQLTDVRLEPGVGMTVGGALVLGGRAPVPMDGRLRVMFGNFEGELQATRPFFRSGAGPVVVELRRAVARFPGGTFEVFGGMGLFEAETSCGLRLDGADASGSRFDVVCADNATAALAGGATGVQLTLRAMQGRVTVPSGTSTTIDYALQGVAGVGFSGLASCKGRFAFTLRPAGFERGESDAACTEGTAASSEHGAVTVRPKTLEVRDFGWAQGTGFTYDLRTTLELDGFAPLKLPVLDGVRVTPAGVSYDAAVRDADQTERLSISALPAWPMGLRQLRLAGGTISWDVWADAARNPFVADFDGALGVAAFQRQLPRDCAWTMRVPFTGATIRNNTLRIEVDGPMGAGCVVPLSTDSAPGLLVERLKGAFVSELAASATRQAETTASGAGADLLKDGVQVPDARTLAAGAASAAASLGTSLVVQYAELERPAVLGAFLVRDIFKCPSPAPPGGIGPVQPPGTVLKRLPITEAIRLRAGGTAESPVPIVVGEVSGFAPDCPIELPAVRIANARGVLRFFDNAGRQGITFTADADAELLLARQPTPGRGRIVLDLVAGRMLEGSIAFQGPLRIELPTATPVLAFEVNAVDLRPDGLHIDGRARLLPENAPAIAATFAGVVIHPLERRLTAGTISFDAPFGLEVGVEANTPTALALRAVAREAPLALASGLRLDLPTAITVTPQGLAVRGAGAARLAFDGREFPSLTTRFSDDFSVALDGRATVAGRVDLEERGTRIAWIDALGFHPDFAGLLALVPARLPLPDVNVAYLQLRDASGQLLVEAVPSGRGVRIATRAGSAVQLVLPALAADGVVPAVDASFTLTLDERGQPSAGAVQARVPADRARAFDLRSRGVPFAVDAVSYTAPTGGGYLLQLDGRVDLFGTAATGSAAVRLTLSGDGRLTGSIDAPSTAMLRMGPDARAPQLRLGRLVGTIDAQLGSAPSVDFAITVDSRFELPLGDGTVWGAQARLLASPRQVTVESLVADRADAAVDIDGVRLALRRLRIPRLTWDLATNTFDWEAQFDLALALRQMPGVTFPEIANVLLRPTGLVIPATTFPDLSAGTVEWQGFRVRPLALRLAETRIDWGRGTVQGRWGIGMDLGISWTDPGGSLPAGLRGVELSALDVGVANGRLTGRITARPVGDVRWPLGSDPQGLALRLRELAGALISAAEAGRPDDANRTPFVDITLTGEIDLGARCTGESRRSIPVAQGTLRLRANGRLEGVLDDIVPPCPITLGTATLEPGRSSIGFGVALPGATPEAGTPAAWLAASGRMRLPAPGGGVASLEGQFALDLAAGTLIDGSLRLLEPVQVAIPAAQPVVRLTASTGTLDTKGLRLTGAADVLGSTGARITTARLEDLTLRLRDFAVTDGRAVFEGAVALTAATRSGSTIWTVAAAGGALPAAPYVRLTSPDRLVLSADGLAMSGAATAQAALSAETTWPALSVQFADGFALGLTPVAVQAGRADLFLNGRRVAYVDRAGLFPDDVLAALPTLPDSIALPSWDVAYLRLKDAGGQFVAQTGLVGSNGFQLTTRPGAPLQLVLAGLRRTPTAAAPVVNVEASVVFNTQNFAPMSGTLVASAPSTGPPLLPLAELGVPIDVRRVALDVRPTGPRVTLSGAVALPSSLAQLPLRFDALELTASGLAGVVELGAFDATWVPGRAVVAQMPIDGTGPSATTLAVTGARLELGASPSVRLSGTLRSPLFAAGGPPAPLFYTATVTAAGATFALDPSSLAGGALPLGPATVTLASVAGQPAAALVATAQEVAVTLSGVLRIPSLDPAFAVSLAGLRVSSASGLTLPQVTVQGTPSFVAGGLRVTLGDPQTTGAALALERDGPAGLALTVVGSVDATGDATLGSLAVCPAGPPASQRIRAQLRVTTAGAVSGRFEDFVPRCPLALGPLTLQPGAMTLGINTPIAAGQPVRAAWLSGSLVATLPALATGAPATARGTATFDLARGELVSGTLTLDGGAGLDLPRENPVLRLRGLAGTVDGNSLRLTGNASLAVPGLPNPLTLAVEGVRFDLRTGTITDGSATIGTSLALQATVVEGALGWALVDPATAPPANATFARLTTPPSLTLSAQGLTFGAGVGSVTYGLSGEAPQPLDVQFVDNFALQLSPFGVRQGRADFRIGTRRLAYLDARGLWPDDVLALVPPLPDRIPLPDVGTAYLRLKNADGQFVVASSIEDGQVRLQMVDNTSTATLVLPGLRDASGAAPEIAVRFSLLVNGRTWAVQAGELDVNTPDDAPALLSLASRGIPVEIRRLRFVADAQGARFTVSARGQLPSVLRTVPLRFENLTLSSRGLEGVVEVGRFDESWVDGRTVVGRAEPFADSRDTLQVLVTGARLELAGGQSALRLSGRVRTTLLASPEATGDDRAAPFFFSGSASATGVTLGLAPIGGGPTVALGPARFDLRATATAPALSLAASSAGVSLTANGSLRAPSLSPTFSVDVTGLRIGTDGIGIGAVRVSRPETAELDLGGVKLSLKDTLVAGQPVAPALALTRGADGIWTFAINGSLLFRDDPFTAALPGCAAVAAAPRAVGVQLRVSTAGDVSGVFSNLAPRCPIRLGAVTITPGPMTFGLNAPLPTGATSATPVVAWLSGAVTAEVAAPAGGGTPIRVAGDAVLDLATPALVGGSLVLQSAARVAFPAAKPLATLEVSAARLDRSGLVLSGAASVLAPSGASLGVQLNDFTLAFADLSVRAGSAVLQADAALLAATTNGAFGFTLVPASAPAPSGAHARLTLPRSLTLDAQGITLRDTVIASLVLPDTTFATLRVGFGAGFRIGWQPLAVADGRADFIVDNRRVAYLDATGLTPDDVLALASSVVPDTLPLGDKATAYLLLKENGQFVVSSSVTGTQMSLATLPGRRVKLAIPALRPNPSQPVGPGNQPRIIETALSLTVNRTTLTPMSGSIDVQAAANQVLFDLTDAGIPVTVSRLGFAAAAGGYRLTVGGAVKLPASLANLDLRIPELTIGPAGIAGTIEAGQPGDNTFVPGRTAIAATAFSPASGGASEEALRLEVTGLRVAIAPATAPTVRVVGRIRSSLFAAAGSTTSADAPLFFTAGVAPATGGVAFTAQVQQVAAANTGVPIGPARLDVSAVRFQASPQEVAVGIDGTLAVPAAGNTFTLAVNNLELSSTRGVVVQNVALGAAQGPRLQLFGLEFALEDVTRAGQTYRALAVDRPAPGTLGLTLAGRVTVLSANNTSVFYGLRVTTAGEFSLAGASLLSQPVDLVPGTARLKTLDFEQGQMRATLGVTLPAPLATGEQEGTIRIARDGTVTGGATINLLAAETRPLCVDNGGPTCASANRLAQIGPVAMVYLRWAGLDVEFSRDFATRSRIRAVADLYLGSTENTAAARQKLAGNRIAFGDLNGTTPTGGFAFTLAGDFTLTGVTASEFTFEVGAVTLRVRNVTAPQNEPATLVSFGADLGMNLPSVQAAVQVTGVKVLKAGGVDLAGVRMVGGTLSIPNVLYASLTDLVYSTQTQTISIAQGGIPTVSSTSAKAPTDTPAEQVTVNFLLSFKGQLSLLPTGPGGTGALLSGGVDQFLFARETNGNVRLVIKGARLAAPPVFEMTADVNYKQVAGGFDLTVGATAKIKVVGDVLVFGAIESRTQPAPGEEPLRLGFFVALNGLSVPLIPGTTVAYLSGLGGGFFWKPRPTWIDAVQGAAGLQPFEADAMRLLTGGGQPMFAAMLYASFAAPDPTGKGFKGKVLITVTNTGFGLNGAFELLGQGENAKGTGQLVVGWRPLGVLGSLNVRIQLGGSQAVTAIGSVRFAFLPDRWAVIGTAQAYIMCKTAPVGNQPPAEPCLVQAQASVAAAAAGFYASVSVQPTLPISFITIKNITAKVFWVAPNQTDPNGLFGIYGEVRVGFRPLIVIPVPEVELFLKGAFITPPVMIYVAGGIIVDIPPIVPRKEFGVYAKFKAGEGLSAGLGKDPAMEALLERAAQVAGDMETVKQEATTAVDQAAAIPPVTPLTTEELSRAFATIGANLNPRQDANGNVPTTAQWAAVLTGLLLYAPDHFATSNQSVKDAIDRYVAVLKSSRDPSAESAILAQWNAATATAGTVVGTLAQARARIAQISSQLTPFLPTWTAGAYADPATATLTPIGTPEQHEPIAAQQEVRVENLQGGPSITLDAAKAATNGQAGTASNAQADQQTRALRQRVTELEAVLASVRAATTATSGGSPLVAAREYAAAVGGVERASAELLNYYIGRKQYFLATRDNFDRVWSSQTDTWLGARTAEIFSANSGLALLSAMNEMVDLRVVALGAFTGNAGLRTTYQQERDATTRDERAAFLVQRATQYGRQLYWQIGREGFAVGAQQLDQSLVDYRRRIDQSLGAARGAAITLTGAVDRLWQAQADAAGVLYDLYDRMLVTIPDLTDAERTQFTARKTALTRLLSVPTVRGLTATVSTNRYLITTSLSWTAAHPDGVTEFQLRDEVAGSNAGSFYSLGPASGAPTVTGSYTTFRAAAPPGGSVPSRQIAIGARGGAGYLGRQSITVPMPQLVEPTFVASPGPGAAVPAGPPPVPAGSTTTSTSVPDATPPSTPTVTLAGVPTSQFVNGTWWVNSRSELAIQWSAADRESGIGRYEYIYGGPPRTTTTAGTFAGFAGGTGTFNPPLLERWTNLGGRTFITLAQPDLPADGTERMFRVRAINGSGTFGNEGTTGPIRYDAVAPTWVGGNTWFGAGFSSGTLFNSPPLFATPFNISPANQCAPSRSEVTGISVQWQGPLGTNPPSPVGATARIMPPAATDALAGVVRYAYRARQVSGTTPAVYDAATWSTVPAGTAMTVAAPGLTAYDRDWVVDVVAIDAAGNVSTVTQTQTFRFRDMSPPGTPDYCVQIVGSSATIRLNARPFDAETDIAGYQYRLTRNGQTVREFPANGAVDAPGNADPFAVAGGMIVDGARHVLSVRSVNGQGLVSNARPSAEIVVDNSPPPTPTISSVTIFTTGTCNGASFDTNAYACVTAVFSAPTDPHSGLQRLEWRAESSAPPPPSNLVLLRTSDLTVGGQAISNGYASSAPGTTTVSILLPSAPGATFTFRLRSVNLGGMTSAEASMTRSLLNVTTMPFGGTPMPFGGTRRLIP